MGWSIDKETRENVLYLIVLIFTFYLSFLNGFVYEAYWCGIIDQTSSSSHLKAQVQRGLPINWLDYYDYGPSIRRVLLFDFEGSIYFYIIVWCMCFMYILLPMICRAFRLCSWSKFILVDLAFLYLYSSIFIYPIVVEAPLYGVIPMAFITPPLLILITLYRVRQYQN